MLMNLDIANTVQALYRQAPVWAVITSKLPCEPGAIVSTTKPLDHEKLKYAFLIALVALHPNSLLPLQLRNLQAGLLKTRLMCYDSACMTHL